MSDFTPWSALTGGALIGVAASILLVTSGRAAGISGIVAGLLAPTAGQFRWRAFFVAGLLAGGLLAALFAPAALGAMTRPALVAIPAGLLVGFGSQLGGGCTSGHGVCGLSRLSRRSLVATAVFMLTAIATVFVWNQIEGAR